MTTTSHLYVREDTYLHRGVNEQVHALETALTELPSARETAMLLAELPGYGEALVIAFVPVDARREQSAQRAIRAACSRMVPSLPALVIPVDEIQYTLDGEVRAQSLFDALLPQIARDLLFPKEMTG